MDPNNQETRAAIENFMMKPIAIMNKAVEAVLAIDVKNKNPQEVKLQVEAVTEIISASAEVRQICLDNVYDNMQRKMDHFSSSIEAYNQGMKQTVENALEMYESWVDTEIMAKNKVLLQRREEFETMLECTAKKAEVDASTRLIHMAVVKEQSEAELERLKKKEDQQHANVMRAFQREKKKAEDKLAREEKKGQSELERQQKKDEQEHKKQEQELERIKKKDD